ncbi:hypothetical protein D5086_017709 [Populus alba]|uniref:Uncharacterized protein n=1 Tax=Populus alba TaxID=43335 RepID=A0ACC4BN49_POPAL
MYSFVHIGFANSICSDFSPPLLPCFLSTRPTDTLRRIVGVYASAPALVFFNLIFVWAVYIFIVRQAIPYFISIVFNIEVTLLILGVCSILSSDPGLVTHGSSDANKLIETKAFGVEAHNEGSALLKRVRYCKSCKAYIKGFDHHCPAFGNCIGQNNYVLFMILLAGFLTTEASYIVCLSQFSRGSQILGGTWFETDLAGSLVVSTMLFSLLQVIWQGVFFTWHLYCICFNIRTDEWERIGTEYSALYPVDKLEEIPRVSICHSIPTSLGDATHANLFYKSSSGIIFLEFLERMWPLARNLNGLDLGLLFLLENGHSKHTNLHAGFHLIHLCFLRQPEPP